MNKLTNFVGAAAMAVSALAMAAPAMAAGHAGGTLVIASTQVPRHLNGAVQSGTATAGATSGSSESDVRELTRRIAELEKRFARLEGLTEPSGKVAPKKPRKS